MTINNTPKRTTDDYGRPIPTRSLNDQPGEYRSASGNIFQLCVVDELTPVGLMSQGESVVAITTIGGLAVCRKHLNVMLRSLREGHSLVDVVEAVLEGEISDD